MTSFKKIIDKITQRPWAVSLFLLLIFLAVNGYKFGWDDQHLELPLLKSLIDPTLYVGDYYVESLKKNFASFLYPLLAEVISLEQISSAYFLLYLLSRYFFLYWIYKLWLYIIGERSKAFICTLSFVYVVRVSEFLYQTFSHQEFAFGIIFAGIYYFFKERFLLAALILGLAANFHALYSGFPMFFIFVYLVLNIKKHGFKNLVLSTLIFLVGAVPFLIWSFKRYLSGYVAPGPEIELGWLNIYRIACGSNFILPMFPFKDLISNPASIFNATQSFLILIFLYILNCAHSVEFRNNKKAQAFCLGAFLLLVLTVVFTYAYPMRFFVDLNLRRNEQYLLFLLGGYTTLLIMRTIERGTPLMALCFGVLFTLLKFGRTITIPAVTLMFLILYLNEVLKKEKSWLKTCLIVLVSFGMLPCLYTIYRSFSVTDLRGFVVGNLSIIWVVMAVLYFVMIKQKDNVRLMALKRAVYIVPMVIFFFQYTYYHYERVQIERDEGGFWLLQRDWRDMQEFVKANTPKDAIIMTPYDLDMDNFRVFSERKVICSERDKGIVGFDMQAAMEWARRRDDMKSFKTALTGSVTTAVQKGIIKYKADYIIFMRYAAPRKDTPLLDLVYTNTTLSLYKVKDIPYFDNVP